MQIALTPIVLAYASIFRFVTVIVLDGVILYKDRVV